MVFTRVAFVALMLGSAQFAHAQCMNQTRVGNPVGAPKENAQRGPLAVDKVGKIGARTITLSQFYNKYGKTDVSPGGQDIVLPPEQGDYVEPCYDGVSVLFQIATLELVVVEGRSIREPETWVNLVSTYFINPAPPLESTPSNDPPPLKIERCKTKRATCDKLNDEQYKIAIAACEDLKPGLPVVNFLVAPVIADCRVQAFNLYKKAALGCELAEGVCLRQP